MISNSDKKIVCHQANENSRLINEETLITLQSLKEWVESKNLHCKFFELGNDTAVQPYLDSSHPHYSQELSAAVLVWQKLQDSELSGKSPKQAITGWLETEAKTLEDTYYKATGKNWTLSGAAIERISTLVNWQPLGGVPKTPAIKENLKVTK